MINKKEMRRQLMRDAKMRETTAVSTKPVTAAPPSDMNKEGLTPRRADDQDHYRDDR